MESLPQSVKLQDVADAAGVSIATASRALGGKKRVSAETAQQVLQAAKRLGYRVDPIARALRAGSTRTAGMVVPVIGNAHFVELIAAVENELQAYGFELILADSHGNVQQEAKRLRTLVDHRVDGVLLVSHDSKKSAAAIREAMRAVPIVQIDRKVDRLHSDFVGIDDAAAMRLILEHLVERGVRTVVLASADDANSAGRGRREAYERLVTELGLLADPHVIDAFSVESGRDAAEEIVRRGELPDAIVAGSDVNAVGVISRLRELGLRVPADVLVTGFDGTQLSEIYNPPITTVQQPVRAVARNAVSFLLSRIADPAEPARDSRINTELVIRASTSAPMGHTR
ncbi:LacI family DNA-binding transcriptional regulator [Streptomyces chartreusis]